MPPWAFPCSWANVAFIPQLRPLPRHRPPPPVGPTSALTAACMGSSSHRTTTTLPPAGQRHSCASPHPRPGIAAHRRPASPADATPPQDWGQLPTTCLLLCLPVERDHALGHQEPHWKEFRFDLTQIPAGEVVTAAEFRIYKVPSTHPLNMTLHVSVFEVVQERSNRCLPAAQARPASVSWSRLWQCVPLSPGVGEHFPEEERGASWENSLTHGRDTGPESPVWPSWLWGFRWVPEPLHLYLPTRTRALVDGV